jgi:hypothetical protein
MKEGIIDVKVENKNGEGIKRLRLKIDEVWEEEAYKIDERRENLERENDENLEQDSNEKDERHKKRKYSSENRNEGNRKRRKAQRKSRAVIKSDGETEKGSDSEMEDKCKEDKVELLIKELEIPSRIKIVINMEDEKNDIEKLMTQYEKLEIGNRLLLKDWYDYGRNFYQNVEDRKRRNEKGKRRKSEKEIKTELYNEMMEHRKDILDENNEIKEKNRRNLKKRTQKAVNVYKLFIEIGNEKLERLREISVTFVVELKEEQRERIVEYFKRK